MRCSSRLKQFGSLFAIVCMYWFVVGCGEGVPESLPASSKSDVPLSETPREAALPDPL